MKRRIVMNSKELKRGDIFIPFGGISDRNQYIPDALKKKCSLVITDIDYPNGRVKKIPNLEQEIVSIFDEHYNYPTKNMKVIGVTGTDGKTTVTSVLSDLLDCPCIGTNGFKLANQLFPLDNTTPSLDVLYDCFNLAREHAYQNIVMEVSSEAYLTKRIANLPFTIGIFTNITCDHLDKHKTFQNYLACKSQLFKNSAIAILNRDSKYYSNLKKISKLSYSYGFKRNSTLQILSFKLFVDKSLIKFKYQGKKYQLFYPLLGKFNVSNVASIILTMLVLGYDMDFIKERFKNIKQVPGRMELIPNLKRKVVIDYAHTKNATLNVLQFFRKWNKNIITIVGCAGGRYKEKRKEIGKIVLKYSKLVIFTMDDPRFEDPNDIIDQMLKGTKKTNYLRIIDRKEAISYAICNSSINDLILILGKGMDKYMLIKDKKIPYSDYEVVSKFKK